MMRKLRFSKKNRFRLTAIPATLFVVLALPNLALADEAPLWLRQAASANAEFDPKKIPAVVLHKEQNVRVFQSGRVTITHRVAVRVIADEGRAEAVASILYNRETAKVRDMRAWVIRPSQEVQRFDKERFLDVEAAPNDVYGEVRAKLITARAEAEPGAVFGCEWTSEESSVFTQFEWQFQERLPVLVSRFSITLPARWQTTGVIFNHPKVEPEINGSTCTWELRGLPLIEDEPASPPVTSLAPRLAVSYFPPTDEKAGRGRVFNTWTDVSRWLTELSQSQAKASGPLAQKAMQLIAGRKTELDRIQAVGSYVQSINYISIQTGLGRGGGYRPHSAAEVFAKSYGDCKDKANLMRAMLKVAGIESYLVGIYSGDSSYVREEWPSPQQFNHCIIAIKVSDEIQAPTITHHPTLGRLLIFDPTDVDTVVGDLPFKQQGSLALIIAGEAGSLIRMPVTRPEAHMLLQEAEATLDSKGGISGLIRETSAGQGAATERSRFRRLSKLEYEKHMEGWIGRNVSGATVTKIEADDNTEKGRFSLAIEFNAKGYAQLLQGRLLVFRPALMPRRLSLVLPESSRTHPVILEPCAYKETVKIKLPDDFDLDEMPGAVRLEASFGSYSTTHEVKDGCIYFTRTFIIENSLIPAVEYEKVREFFERARAAEQSLVVLVKK